MLIKEDTDDYSCSCTIHTPSLQIVLFESIHTWHISFKFLLDLYSTVDGKWDVNENITSQKNIYFPFSPFIFRSIA